MLDIASASLRSVRRFDSHLVLDASHDAPTRQLRPLFLDGSGLFPGRAGASSQRVRGLLDPGHSGISPPQSCQVPDPVSFASGLNHGRRADGQRRASWDSAVRLRPRRSCLHSHARMGWLVVSRDHVTLASSSVWFFGALAQGPSAFLPSRLPGAVSSAGRPVAVRRQSASVPKPPPSQIRRPSPAPRSPFGIEVSESCESCEMPASKNGADSAGGYRCCTSWSPNARRSTECGN